MSGVVQRAAGPLLVLAAIVFLAGGFAASAPPAAALSSTVVISQVYGGGGNSSAPYRNDYVELLNRGPTAVSLDGWSIQYASATGAGTFASNPITSLAGPLEPGQYYLVQMASGGSSGSTLPTPDASGSASMAATGGKVVLVNTTTGLACNGGSIPCSTAELGMIVDLIGWGNADFYEGAAPGPATMSTTAVLRTSDGCAETDDNAADFTAGTPNPRNTASLRCIRPAISSQPADQTVADGEQASFSAAASGRPAPSVKWQASSDGGATWADVPGATAATFAFTAVAQNGDRYRAVFMNALGSATSEAARLTVDIPPAISSQPADQTVADGEQASFSAAASGRPAPSVRWQASSDGGATWADVPGATEATLAFAAAVAQNGDRYRAVFTNALGSATSEAARLTVRVTTAKLRTQALRRFRVRRGHSATFRFRVLYSAPAGQAPAYRRARVVLRIRDANGRSRFSRVFSRSLLNRAHGFTIPHCHLKKGTYRYSISATLPDGQKQQRRGSARFVVR